MSIEFWSKCQSRVSIDTRPQMPLVHTIWWHKILVCSLQQFFLFPGNNKCSVVMNPFTSVKATTFLSADKKSSLVSWCAVNSDKSETRSGLHLVGRYLTVLDLKTSCQALSASVQWTKTICWCFSNMASFPTKQVSILPSRHYLDLDDLAPSLNAVSCDKKILTQFDPDKKSAVLRPKIG